MRNRLGISDTQVFGGTGFTFVTMQLRVSPRIWGRRAGFCLLKMGSVLEKLPGVGR